MKLRNKKTGEVVCPHNFELFRDPNNIVIGDYEYSSLAELNEDWEDYEEPEGWWFIDRAYEPHATNSTLRNLEADRQIGNYFETKEEAELAVQKLKAWKRLKDNGFEFGGWKRDDRYCGDFTITATDQTSCDDKDLDLLFGIEQN